MSDFQVAIEMDQTTVQTLAAADCVLGGLLGAQCATPGLPALYFVTPNFGLTTTVSLSPSYLAYASATAAAAGSVVSVASAYPVQPGATLTVTDATGDGTVTPPPSGTPGTAPITITSATALPSSGLAAGTATSPVALCSFPLAAATPNAITPLPLLFLSFWLPSTPAPAPGVALATSPGAGILVDLAQATAPVVVTYQYPDSTSTTYGWGWDATQTGITAYNVGESLPALLNPPA